MPHKISERLSAIVDALPLKKGVRVLEIGCGTGLAALEIVRRVEDAYVLALDRSPTAINQANKNGEMEVDAGRLTFLQAKIEAFELPDNEPPFDFAFAIRVGALDGRHPEIEVNALKNISKALKKGGKLYIDGGNPLKEVDTVDK